MTDEREGAPLWARALAYALVVLMVVTALVIVAALAVWALHLLIEGLAWLTSLAWGGGATP